LQNLARVTAEIKEFDWSKGSKLTQDSAGAGAASNNHEMFQSWLMHGFVDIKKRIGSFL
jgi:hypothetical protein